MRPSPLWLEITVPSRSDMIRPIQVAALDFAARAGFDRAGCARIELAIEEAFRTVLRYSFRDEAAGGEITWRFDLAAARLRASLFDRGMPFDLSMVPDYPDRTPPADDDADRIEPALSFHLLNHSVDQCTLVNNGRDGLRLDLTWLIPADNIADLEAPSAIRPATADEPVDAIRVIGDAFAIQVARLVYRGYGYSYVYEDVYYPARVQAHYAAGTLTSWGALTGSDRLAGHLALMKDSAASVAVEWGLVVVDPAWRGRRIMERLLQAALESVSQSDCRVFYAHAVTAHPFTQKTCERFGFQPTALLLGYAPATLSFRDISPTLRQRESTFTAVRLMQPLPPAELYLPDVHATGLHRIFTALQITGQPGIHIRERVDDLDLRDVRTRCVTSMITGINGATMTVDQVGGDCAKVLRHELRRLCNERVDVIYLTVDLRDPGNQCMIDAAESAGFFVAGFTPSLMGPDYGFTMQFMNNQTLDFDAIHAFSPAWQQIKSDVMGDKARVERA